MNIIINDEGFGRVLFEGDTIPALAHSPAEFRTVYIPGASLHRYRYTNRVGE